VIHSPVLVLNRHYLPIHITSVKRAFSLVYRGTAKVLNENLETFDFQGWRGLPISNSHPCIGLVTQSIRVPRVVLSTTYDGQPRRTLRFSRILVLIRDQYKCQYCGATFPLRGLNLDHVIPRRYGGSSSWDNVVCCCLSCNRKKGGRTPEEAGMSLLRPPRAPGYTSLANLVPHADFVEEWTPFLIFYDRKHVSARKARTI
jgi:5-methylcytosine-specific restriction endonuclease McrA